MKTTLIKPQPLEQSNTQIQPHYIPRLQALILLSIPIFLIYGKTLNYGFIEIDDGGQIYENALVQSISLENIFLMFSTPVVGMYQPMTSLMNAIIVYSFGNDASALHALSTLLHWSNTLLIYLLARSILANENQAIALALFFTCHPLMVEPVVWISALSTLWFTLFFLLSLLSYFLYINQNKLKHAVASLAFFTLGCFFKVQIIPLVGVLILTDIFFREPTPINKIIMEKIPFVIVALTFIAVALNFRGDSSGFVHDHYPSEFLTPAQLLWYPLKLVFPYNLGIQYDWPKELWNALNISGYLFLLVAMALLIRLRKQSTFVFGILFYGGNIALHTAIFTQFLGPYADRYAYLSSFGILLAVIGLIPKTLFSNARLISIGVIILTGYSYFAARQVNVWKSTLSVWSNNLKHQKATFSNGMRGALYLQQGDLEKAKNDFEIIVNNPDTRIDPDKYAYIYTNLGIMAAETDANKAEEYFYKAVQFKPSPNAFANVAKISLKLGKTDEAETAYLKALSIDNNHLQSLSELVGQYFQLNELEKTLPLLNQLLKIQPNNPLTYQQRAFILVRLGHWQAAQEDLKVAQGLFEKKSQKLPPNIRSQQQARLMEIQNLIDQLRQIKE